MHREERIIKMIDSCTNEQINNDRGMPISTEFSSTMLPTNNILKIIDDAEVRMSNAGLSLKWRYYNCEVCKQHDADYPIHYETYDPKYENIYDDL